MGTCPHHNAQGVPLPSPDLAAFAQNSAPPPLKQSSASPGLPGNFSTFQLIRIFNRTPEGLMPKLIQGGGEGIFLIREKIRDR